MSKLLITQLKQVKPFLKPKGLSHEQYGVIKNGQLYYNNLVCQIQMPIAIPFDCCINLYELYTILSAVKDDTVIVCKDEQVQVLHGETSYSVTTMPLNSMDDNLNFNYNPEFVECDNPQVFKTMMDIAENYTQMYEDVTYLKYAYETLIVDNGQVMCSDRYNIIQGVLDFNMPNLAITLPEIIMFNKIAKNKKIIAMALCDDVLCVHFDSDLILYVKCCGGDAERLSLAVQKINKAMLSNWDSTQYELPQSVKSQILTLIKIAKESTAQLTDNFCKIGDKQINYASFTKEPLFIKCTVKNLQTVLTHAYTINVKQDKGLSFLNEQHSIRGFIGAILDDEPANYGIPQ